MLVEGEVSPYLSYEANPWAIYELKADATIVVEYMSRFDKLTIRCDIRKNLRELYGLAFVFESASVCLSITGNI